DRLEPGQLGPGHDARVEVWQQPRLLQDADRHRPHVVERRVEASGFEPVAGLGPALLRAVPEGEQGFLAARLRAAAAELHHLIGLEEHALARGAELPRNGDERAVVAPVAAQPGEWDEDLAGVGDDPGSALVDESGVPAGRGE